MARPSEGAEEEGGGVVELGEGGAGDHVADFGEGGVGAEAVAFAGDAHPDICAGVAFAVGRLQSLTARARAQSSMTSLRMAERPPMRSSAARRRRMQPPAAPAVFDFAFAIFEGG